MSRAILLTTKSLSGSAMYGLSCSARPGCSSFLYWLCGTILTSSSFSSSYNRSKVSTRAALFSVSVLAASLLSNTSGSVRVCYGSEYLGRQAPQPSRRLVQLRDQPALLVVGMSEKRHRLFRLHTPLDQVAGGEELSVGLVRPAKPLRAACREQAGT